MNKKSHLVVTTSYLKRSENAVTVNYRFNDGSKMRLKLSSYPHIDDEEYCMVTDACIELKDKMNRILFPQSYLFFHRIWKELGSSNKQRNAYFLTRYLVAIMNYDNRFNPYIRIEDLKVRYMVD